MAITREEIGRRWRYLEGQLIAAYYKLVLRTSHFEFEGNEHWEAAKASGRPILWAVWHGINVPFVMFGVKYTDPGSFLIIIVGDERADVLTGLAHGLGASAVGVDMDGNPVASGRAVLNLIKALKSGKQTFLSPDGPNGPAFVPKKGVFYIAKKAGAALMPIGFWSRPSYEMKRWDRYQIPFPFSKIKVAIDAPIFVDRNTDDEILNELVPERMHAVRTRAQEMAGITPFRDAP